MTLLLAALVSACAGAGPQLDQAAQALGRRDLEQAARALAPLESEYPACWKVNLALGRLRYEQGDYRHASTFSELALLSAPEDPEALVLRAQILLLGNQVTQARELLEKACRLDPGNAEAHYQLGVLHDGARRGAEALAEFEKVTRLRPGDARAWDYLALNLGQMGEIARAEAAYQKALAVNQGPLADPFVDYNYGRLLLKLNQLEEGRKHLDRALQLSPGTRAVHYEHGRLNLRLGRLQDARADAERALALPDPGGFILDLQIFNLLVQIHTRLGDEAQARKYAQLSEKSVVPVQALERR